ncbi:MAG: ATP-binding cassette domain-containing protein [Acidobacteria bacterium]|nr:ATP-binding cassette domain-containing protein [Acidobacteriota bacterium]
MKDQPLLHLDVRADQAGFRLEVQASLGPAAAVLGPSGAGKTTLLEVLAGLRWAKGRIRLGDRVLQDSEEGVYLPPERRQLGYVPQEGALFPHLSVRRNLLFGRTSSLRTHRFQSPEERREFERLVEALDLGGLLERVPASLSGGERRRVALGRALLARPQLLLLDEPTTGLDGERARAARGLVQRLRDELEVPMLLVTHRPEEALALAHEVLLLEGGRVRACGPAEAVMRRPEVLASWPEWAGENQVRGRVLRHDVQAGTSTVQLDDGPTVSVPLIAGAEPGAEVVLGVGAEEVLIATDQPSGLSARNVLGAVIDELVTLGSVVYVRAGGWYARLTPAAVGELELETGRPIWLVIKTHSWRVVAL